MSADHGTPSWVTTPRSLAVSALALALAATAQARADAPPIRLAYAIDRSAVPDLTYRDLTLKISVGAATRVSCRAGGAPVPVLHDRKAGVAILTTAAPLVELEVEGADAGAPGFGDVAKAALLGDKRWAWSHGFDDNTGFKEHGLEAFRRRGWTASLFLICASVDLHREEPWIVDAPDIRRLVREGWGIGNHSWSHQTVRALGGPAAARADVLRCADLLRSIVRPVRPDYHLVAFAAPAFDHDYQAVVDELRGGGLGGELLYNESGGDFLRQIDPGAFDPKATVGRDPAIEGFGSGSPSYDNKSRLLRIHELADGDRHYWYNTLSHGVDRQYPDRGLFAFLDHLHQHFGPAGTDEVWVAPSDRVYSYLVVRDASRVTRVDPRPATAR